MFGTEGDGMERKMEMASIELKELAFILLLGHVVDHPKENQ